MNTSRLLTEAATLVESENGTGLATLMLSLSNHLITKSSKRESIPQRATRTPNEDWTVVLTGYFFSLQENPKSPLGLKKACESLLAMHRILGSSDAWVLPVLYTLTANLVSLASHLKSQGCYNNISFDSFSVENEPEDEIRKLTGEAARILNKTLSLVLTDRSFTGARCRIQGTYRVCSHLLRLYFSIGQLNLCQNVLRALGAASSGGILGPISSFPPTHTAPYLFLIGKFHLLSGNYSEARSALVECKNKIDIVSDIDSKRSSSKKTNVGKINWDRLYFSLFERLTPLILIGSGKKPKVPVSVNSKLNHDLIEAVRKGDLPTFESLITLNRINLLRVGTYTIWEELGALCVRRLLQRICKHQRSTIDQSDETSTDKLSSKSTTSKFLENSESKSSISSEYHLSKSTSTVDSEMTRDRASSLLQSQRIPLNLVARLIERSLPSATSIICSLIERSWVRGYVSYAHALLVLSSANPFPPIFIS